MNRLWKYPLFMAMALGGICCIEQILYRFSEEYAKQRADWLWSLNKEHPDWSWLKALPFDQWKSFPTHDGKARPELLAAETQYLRASLSHTRALRDKLFNELRLPLLPAETLLRDTQTSGIVYIQIPREEETRVQATILRVVNPEDYPSGDDLDNLEFQIIPMERREFACGFIRTNSEHDLLRALRHDLPAALDKLDVKDKSFATRIFAWGKGSSADLLARAFSESPKSFAGLVLESPTKTLPSVPTVGTFALFLTDDNTDDAVCRDALKWIRELRKNNSKTGADRFGGMLSHGNGSALDPANYRLALTYGFMNEVNRALGPPPQSFSQANLRDEHGPASANVKHEEGPSPLALPAYFFAKEEVESPTPPPNEAELFDCSIVQKYRREGPDPNLRQLPNKDLILILGRRFEQANAMDHIRELDPLFVEFYESIKLMDGSGI